MSKASRQATPRAGWESSRDIKVDLEFDSLSEAEAFRVALQDLWGSGRAAPALAGSAQARIVEEVQSEEY